jgi:FMN phosphatase YigB (HAD superfamily)
MDHYKKAIDTHDVISFDIFDTLLVRVVAAPADAFSVAHELFNQESDYVFQEDFRPLRLQAERNARLNKVTADVTLEDIYRHFSILRPDLHQEFVDTLREFELKAEGLLLVRNYIAELYSYAKQKGKKVAIVSDMYLPKKAIEGYLQANGIEAWDLLIVSCEDHVSKASGTAYVALKEAFPSKKIVHFGDNYHDDIVTAKWHGIHAEHVRSNAQLARDTAILPRVHTILEAREVVKQTVYLGQVQQSIVDALVINDAAKDPYNIDRLIGFGVLGPLLVGFSQWLHESLVGDGCDKVLFLARDGNIMHKAYNSLYDKQAIANEYIFGSRRALVFPSLRVLTGEDIRTFAQLDRGASLSSTLETFNLSKKDPRVQKAAKASGVDLRDDYVDSTNAHKIEAFLLGVKDDILESARQERQTVLRYLNHVGFDKSQKVAVCDIGWNGSVRTVLENYIGREVPGYYLGLRNVEKTVHAGNKIQGYFDARKDFDWREFAPVVAGGVEVIEFLFSNPDQGPIKKIVETSNGTFEAPQGAHDFPEDRRTMIRDVQASALEFIEQYKLAVKPLPRSLWQLDRHSGLSNIITLIDTPSEPVARAIGESPYATSVGSKPELIGAPTRSNFYYRTHFRSLKKEWGQSFWGQGFKVNARARGLKRHRL